MPFRNNENTSFIDVISNLLGVVIIITLLLVLAKTAVLGSIQSRENILQIIPKEWQLFSPRETYYLVFDEYMIVIDFDTLAQEIFTIQAKDWQSGQGRVKRFQLDLFEEVHRRDPISYIIEFTPDLDLLKQNHDIIDLNMLPDLLKQNQTTIPVFIVLESGIPLFADIYLYIKQKRIRHRWFTWPKDKRTEQYHITFSYEHGNFTRRDIRR